VTVIVIRQVVLYVIVYQVQSSPSC